MVKEKISSFTREFRKATVTALVAAFGFVAAFSWKDVVTEYFSIISIADPLYGKILTAIIVTFFSVIAIIVLTKFMPVESEE